MNQRFCAFIGALVASVALLAPVSAAAQAATAAKKPAPVKTWTPPRTPDGQPDLQGTWTNPTITPFERPVELANKQFLTETEAAELEKQAAGNRVDRPPKEGDVGNYNQFGSTQAQRSYRPCKPLWSWNRRMEEFR